MLSVRSLQNYDLTQGRNYTQGMICRLIHEYMSIHKAPDDIMVKSLSYPHIVCSLTGDTDKWRGHYKTLCIERKERRRSTKPCAGFRKEHEVLAGI